ncbi:MAG: TIR domain-containing protein [Phycisphaerales bacterium]
MTDKFHGTPDELKAHVQQAGFDGVWSEGTNGQHQFKTKDGGVLCWWPSKGTLLFQGQTKAKDRLIARLSPVLADGVPATPMPAAPVNRRRIFVVHGHDTTTRDQLELALHRLGLQPFILMNSSGGGKTIIEALEGHIGRDYSSDFGIVLMTPDDIGYATKDGAPKAEPRARQNVVLETGMLLASLTRDRMALLVKGHLELPSDLQGIIRYGFNDHIREIIPKLCTRFQEVGITTDSGRISEACA